MNNPDTTKLREFMRSMTKEEQKVFAQKVNTSVGYLMQVMYGNNRCSAQLAIDIDRESGGKVPCDDLCPSADFAYLRTCTS